MAEEKSAPFWKAFGTTLQGWVLAQPATPSDAVHQITSGITAYRSTGSTYFAALAIIFGESLCGPLPIRRCLRCIDEAIATVNRTKERWWEAKVDRIAGEITLMSPEPDAAKAEAYLERALAVARQQQAKSWELAQQ